MNKEEKDKWLHIKDLEAELDYYHLYEPKDRTSIHRLQDKIDDLYEEMGFPKTLPTEPVENPLKKLKEMLNDD